MKRTTRKTVAMNAKSLKLLKDVRKTLVDVFLCPEAIRALFVVGGLPAIMTAARVLAASVSAIEEEAKR